MSRIFFLSYLLQIMMMDTSHISCGYMYPMILTTSKEPYKCNNIDATANSLPLLFSRRIRPSCLCSDALVIVGQPATLVEVHTHNLSYAKENRNEIYSIRGKPRWPHGRHQVQIQHGPPPKGYRRQTQKKHKKILVDTESTTKNNKIKSHRTATLTE